MTDSGDRPRWRTEQRFEFIEFRLFWEGAIRRADIAERFDVSVPQATNDLNLYREQAPENLIYDSSRKRFLPTPQFQPKFLKINADRYLAQLKAVADRVLQIEDTALPDSPPVDAMPIPRRLMDPWLLRRLVAAVRKRRSIEVLYQSMNADRPEPIWRRISPHAFAHDGMRWHIRAFCHLSNSFKDFIISRCSDLRNEGEPGAQPDQDDRWAEFFDVILEPNPMLARDQRRVIAMDYDMTDGRLVVPVRKALLYYFNKRLRLDVAGALDKPAETPIVVANRLEFVEMLRVVSGG